MACGCTTGCHGNCDRSKLGIACLIFCKECMGVNCENGPEVDVSQDDDLLDADEDIEMFLEYNVENE